MTTQLKKQTSMRRKLYQRAILESLFKLNPRWMVRNPVMFVVEVGSVLTTLLWIQALFGRGEAPRASSAPSRSGCGSPCCSPTSPKPLPRGAARPKPKRSAAPAIETQAKRLKVEGAKLADFKLQPSNLQPGTWDLISSAALRRGDVILVETGDTIPADGEVVVGIASVDESPRSPARARR